MPKTLLIHHNDLDGFSAGAQAMMAFPQAEPLCLGYGDPSAVPGIDRLQEYDTVIIVDYTLPVESMKWLRDNRRFLWIDHHLSAIKLSQANGYADAEGLRCEPGALICAAELAWRFFQGERPLPRMLRLVGDQDTFRNSTTSSFTNEALPFLYGIQPELEKHAPAHFHDTDYPWKTPQDLERDDICQKYIEKGTAIQEYNNYYNGTIAKEFAFERVLWGGKRVLCLNSPGHGSLRLQPAFDPARHDAMLLFSFDGEQWDYGLYAGSGDTNRIDCSAIAASYGGGGHKGAAGFTTKELLPGLLQEPKE
jgi:uncharacterized protein